MAMRVKNIAAGFYDSTGFHPVRSSADYDPDRAGDSYSQRSPKAKRKKKASGRKPRPKAHRARTAKVSRKRNPIPVKWATAKVRKLGNNIQVMLFPKRKVAKRRARRRNPRRTPGFRMGDRVKVGKRRGVIVGQPTSSFRKYDVKLSDGTIGSYAVSTVRPA